MLYNVRLLRLLHVCAVCSHFVIELVLICIVHVCGNVIKQ